MKSIFASLIVLLFVKSIIHHSILKKEGKIPFSTPYLFKYLLVPLKMDPAKTRNKNLIFLENSLLYLGLLGVAGYVIISILE